MRSRCEVWRETQQPASLGTDSEGINHQRAGGVSVKAVLQESSFCVRPRLTTAIPSSINQSVCRCIKIYIVYTSTVSIHRSIYLSVHRSIYLSVHRSIYLSIHRSIYLSIHLSLLQFIHIYLCTVSIYIHLSIYLSIYLSIHQSIVLSIHLSILLSIYLSLL